MECDGIARRNILRWGAGVSGGSILTGLSGCLTVPGVEGEERASYPAYTRWIPLQPKNTGFFFVDLDHLFEHGEYLDARVQTDFTEEFEDLGFAPEDLDYHLSMSLETTLASAQVKTGSFESDTIEPNVRSRLETNQFVTEEYGEYTIYVPEEDDIDGTPPLTRAVADGVFITAPTADVGLETVAERLIDAEQNEASRYVEENEDFDLLTTHLGENTIEYGLTLHENNDIFDTGLEYSDPVAFGESWSVNGDTSTSTIVLIFESEDDIDMDLFDEEIVEDHDLLTSDDLTVETDGRTLLGSGEFDTIELDTTTLLNIQR